MTTELAGQVAIVTGASSGLGRATAQALAAAGVHIVATARRDDRLQTLQGELARFGVEAMSVAGDASEEATAQAAIGLALETFGKVDILINNAGAGLYKPFHETTPEEFDGLVSANLRSGFVFSRGVLPHMVANRRGVILFISSVAGLQGPPNEAVYAATKFAQTGLAQSLEAEYRKHGIKVGVVHAGGMKTEFAIGKGRDAETVADSRMMEAAEVAKVIVYACGLPPNLRMPQFAIRHMG